MTEFLSLALVGLAVAVIRISLRFTKIVTKSSDTQVG